MTKKIPSSQYIRRRVITVLPLLFASSSRKRPQQVPDLHSPAVKGGPFAASLWILGGMSSRCPAHFLSSVRCSEAMFICFLSIPLSTGAYRLSLIADQTFLQSVACTLRELSVRFPADYSLRHCLFILPEKRVAHEGDNVKGLHFSFSHT